MTTREAMDIARSIELSITGMTCGGCANTVTRVLSRVPGVIGARVDVANGSAVIEGTAQPEEVIRAVQAAGFEAQLRTKNINEGSADERRHGRGCC